MTTIVASPASSQLQLPVPPELSAEAAREIVLTAQAEFAAQAEHNRSAAVYALKKNASRWSNHFSNKRDQRLAYLFGTLMDGETHTITISMPKLVRKYEKLHSDRRRNRAPKLPNGKQGNVSDSTLKRHIARFEKFGVLTVARTRQGESHDLPGTYAANVYTVHVDIAVVNNAKVPHDFLTPPANTKTAAHLGGNQQNDLRADPRVAARVAAISVSNPVSDPISDGSSSSPPDGADEHDDDAAAVKQNLGEGSSTRVGEGAARDDQPSARSRASGKTPASAASPGGDAPAVAARPAPRENRGELEDWAQEKIEELNEFMVEVFKPHINPSKKLILQMVTQAREHSPDMVSQAIWWCFDGYSTHHHVVEMDNPAGILTQFLPGIVSDYAVARERQTRELEPEERAGFDLYGWCKEQAEVERQQRVQERRAAQERAEREAEAQAEREAAKERAEGEAQERADRRHRETVHKREHPDHYDRCGECRRCQIGSSWCPNVLHRADDSPDCKEFSGADAEARAERAARAEERAEREVQKEREHAALLAEQQEREKQGLLWEIDRELLGPDKGQPCAYWIATVSTEQRDIFRGAEEELLATYPELRGHRY